jgi:hypothetical protein
LIQFYSEASPPVAAAIAENDALRSVTRWLLLPVIGVAYLAIHPGITTMILLMALAVWAGWSMLSTARGARSKRSHF